MESTRCASNTDQVSESERYKRSLMMLTLSRLSLGHRALASAWTLGVLRHALSSRLVRLLLSKLSDKELHSDQKSKRTIQVHIHEDESDKEEDGGASASEEEIFMGGISAISLWQMLVKAASLLESDVRFDTSTNIDTIVSTMTEFATNQDASRTFYRSSSMLPNSPKSPLSFSRSVRRGNFGEISGFNTDRSTSPTGLPSRPGITSRSLSMARRYDMMHKKGAAGRGCKVNREGIPLLLPMSYDESVVAIQSHYRVHVASQRYKRLMNEIRMKIRGGDEGGEKKTIVLTDDDREAARIAMERLASGSAAGGSSMLRSSLEVYFDHSPLLSPGVAAVETLFDVLTALPSALSHFLALIDIPALLKVLNLKLPLRNQHIALLCFSALLRGGVAFVPPPSSSESLEDSLLLPCYVSVHPPSPRTLMEVGHMAERMDPSLVNDLISKLSSFIEMEYAEHLIRYGPGAPALSPDPGPRRGYARVIKMMQPQIRDARWREQGSMISAHAAVCSWGVSSRVLPREARQEAALRMQREARAGNHVPSVDPVGLMMKGGPGGEIVPLEASVREIVKMTSRGLLSSTSGLAVHVLSTAVVSLGLEPASLALLVRSGLVDLGDTVSEVLTKQQRSKNQKQGIAQPRESSLGLTNNQRGLVGQMVDTGKGEHAECAAALLALTVMGERKLNGEARDESKANLASQLWAGRVIRAGGWNLLTLCLEILPRSREMQTVVAIAARYMAEEIAIRAMHQEERDSEVSHEGDEAHDKSVDLATPKERPDPRLDTERPLNPSSDREWLGVNTVDMNQEATATATDSIKGKGKASQLLDMFVPSSSRGTMTLPQALSLLSCLINNGDAAATGAVSSPQAVMFSSIACHHLAVVDRLRDPLGEAGLVASLMSAARRWVDGTISEQRDQRRTTEWVMAALLQLLQGREGKKNVDRLAKAYKPPTAEEEAMREMKTFGNSAEQKPGAKPLTPVRTPDDLISSTLWHGLGWGKGGLGASSAASHPASQLHYSQHSKEDDYEDGKRASAVDPISVLCQIVDVICPRHKSIFINIKLPALKLLKLLSKVRDYRIRMVSAGAGERLVTVSMDPLFDSKTRSAAAALWMFISETDEGKDPRWWSCLRGPASGPLAAGPEAEAEVLLRCRASFQVELLFSNESDSEVVGAKGAISLSYQGDEAKDIFIQSGGLEALVHVMRKEPVGPTRVLAPVCTALLNLSSYVPVQPKMTAIVDRLIRLNSYFSQLSSSLGRFNKTKGNEDNLHSPSHADTDDASSLKSGHSHSSISPQLQAEKSQDDHLHITDILYGTSGALNNLSKHPDNVSCLYSIELSKKTEAARGRQGEKTSALPMLSVSL